MKAKLSVYVIVAMLVSALFTIGIGRALAGGTRDVYRDRDGNRIVERRECLHYEDTAAQVKLAEFVRRADGTLKVVLTCGTP